MKVYISYLHHEVLTPHGFKDNDYFVGVFSTDDKAFKAGKDALKFKTNGATSDDDMNYFSKEGNYYVMVDEVTLDRLTLKMM